MFDGNKVIPNNDQKTQYGFILKFWVNISSMYSLIFEDSDTKVMFFLKTNRKGKIFS